MTDSVKSEEHFGGKSVMVVIRMVVVVMVRIWVKR